MERRVEEKPFPDDLEGRLASVANAVNTELKTVTLLHLDDRPADRSEIKVRIRETIGMGYLPSCNVFGNYGNTLHDIALVARETVIRDTGDIEYIGYSLTEAGKKYGVPIAASALKYVVDNDRSMFSILGQTTSHGETRAPHNRIRILENLIEKGKLRVIDLCNFLGLRQWSVQTHLRELQKIGFVNYDSVGTHRDKITYEWIEGKEPSDAKVVKTFNQLTKKVAKYLSDVSGKVSTHEVAEGLKIRSSDYVSKILSGLVEEGFVRREGWKVHEILSEIEILDEGRKFIEDWILPTRETLANGEALEDLEKIYGQFQNRNIFAENAKGAIESYIKISPGINRKSLEIRIEQIRNYLIEHPGSMTEEVAEHLGLSRNTVVRYIRKLKNEIISKRDRNEVRYFLKDKS
jgi:predicted transcriptional regulator